MKKQFNDESRKVIDEIFTAEPFQSAMQEICGAAEVLDRAQSNPREYFAHFGVDLPKDCNVEVIVKEVRPRGKTKTASAKKASGKIICVSWCTKNACYTYCAVLQH